ncbi:helix-turn-helix domain-containing protein [Natronomonas marina]|jgi:hypothetical protein|uniref:helix-turn-helix domain-containing protein n=1 Tax=Natronomonas marina TaxID=2961939 RepID=UPI0020C983D6|nr:helix-turn-helix domain-containing protein [Natronomonas marina]
MALAELDVRLPEGTWIHDVSTAHPEACFRVLAGMPDGDVGFALLSVTAPSLEPILEAMAAHEGLTDIESLRRDGDRALLRVETTAPLLLLSARAAGIPVEPPVEIRDGVACVAVRATRNRLSTLGEQLERFGLSYTVASVYDDVQAESLLSDRQADLLLAAVERGYYDTPRGCSLTELADEFGIAKSTCSETLHRAESRVVRQFVDRNLAPGGADTDRDERPPPGDG